MEEEIDQLFTDATNCLSSGIEECERAVDADLGRMLEACGACLATTGRLAGLLKYKPAAIGRVNTDGGSRDDGGDDEADHDADDIAQAALQQIQSLLTERISILQHSGTALLKKRTSATVPSASHTHLPPPLPSSSNPESPRVLLCDVSDKSGSCPVTPDSHPIGGDHQRNTVKWPVTRAVFTSSKCDTPLSSSSSSSSSSLTAHRNLFPSPSTSHHRKPSSPSQETSTLKRKIGDGLAKMNGFSKLCCVDGEEGSTEQAINLVIETRRQKKQKIFEKTCERNRVYDVRKVAWSFDDLGGFGIGDVLSTLTCELVKPLLSQTGLVSEICKAMNGLHFSMTSTQKPKNKVLLYGADDKCMLTIAESVCSEVDAVLYNVDVDGSVLGGGKSGGGCDLATVLQLILDQQSEHGRRVVILLEHLDRACIDTGGGGTLRGQILTLLAPGSPLDNGLAHRVVLLATTTKPWLLDTTFINAFYLRLYIPLANECWRKKVLSRVFADDFGVHLTPPCVDLVTELTDGLTLMELHQLALNTMCETLRDLKKSALICLQHRGSSTVLEVNHYENRLLEEYQAGKVSVRKVELSDIVKALWCVRRCAVGRCHVLRLKHFHNTHHLH